jgi:hypothetical protein
MAPGRPDSYGDGRIDHLRASVGPSFGSQFDRVTLEYVDLGYDYDWAQLEAASRLGENLPPPALMALTLCRSEVPYQEAKARAKAQYGYWA